MHERMNSIRTMVIVVEFTAWKLRAIGQRGAKCLRHKHFAGAKVP